MSAKKRSTARPERTKSGTPVVGQEPLSFIPEKFRTLGWIALILLSLLVFFGGPITGGEYMGADDNVSWESYRTYLQQVDEAGESPQWMPYMFSGMPGVAAYMVTGDRSWDLSMEILEGAQAIFSIVNPDIMRVLFYYLILGIGVYALMRWRGVRRSVAFFSAFATIFSTWIIVWIMIGHNTKPMVLAFLPWVILFAGLLMERWSLLWAGLLILAVHFLFESAHPQTALYGAFTVAIWWITELIFAFRDSHKSRLPGVIRAGLVGVAAAIFAVGMGWDRVSVAAFDYNDYSTRGVDPLVEEYSPTQDPYEYATAWSYDVDETFTYVVPTYFGFGSLEMTVPGRPEQPYPTYWGNDLAPFTDAGHYMGIIVLILALYGFWRFRSSPFALGIGISGLLGLFLSWGGNFSLIYDLFYNVVPLFGKFRAPSQSLVMLEFAGPILAGFGLSAILNQSTRPAEENRSIAKNFLMLAGGAIIFGLIVFALQGSWTSAMSSDPGLMGTYQGQVPEVIAQEAFAIMRTDWLFSAFFAALFAFLAWRFLRGELKGTILIVAVILLTAIDLFRIDARAMHKNEPKEQLFSVFNETSADAYLKGVEGTFRIADVTRHPSYPAYHLHQHIGGYSAAKMRRYQDLMDATAQGSTSMPGPGLAWDLLNTRYLISAQPAAATDRLVHEGAGVNVYERPTAMPRAWFTGRVEVKDDREILSMIAADGFDPREVAFVSEDMGVEIADRSARGTPEVADPVNQEEDDGETADGEIAESPAASYGEAEVTRWEPHFVGIKTTTTDTRLLVVSEMYYPPGWKAYLDGEPVETIRTNYLLRGIVVPAGEHTVEFRYESESHDTGVMLSLILNIVVLGMIAVGGFLEYRRRTSASADDESPETRDEDAA